MLTLIAVTIWVVALPFYVTQAYSTYDGGDGVTYRLNVVQDVWLEGSWNKNGYQWLLVGRHPGFPKKRSLIQFENLPASCPVHRIRWAKMYLYFQYAHKASGDSITQTPYISRPIQVHLVKKQWSESQATSKRRLNGINWSQPYLDFNNTDIEATSQDCVTTIYTLRPKGFVEFDVTRAVRSWRKSTPNHGLLLWATDENLAGRDLRFTSNADPDPKKHAFINVMCDYSDQSPVTYTSTRSGTHSPVTYTSTRSGTHSPVTYTSKSGTHSPATYTINTNAYDYHQRSGSQRIHISAGYFIFFLVFIFKD